MVNLKVEKINKYQPHFEFNETYKEIEEKPKARKDAEDFSLIFDKACKEVSERSEVLACKEVSDQKKGKSL